jgi:hypothetical protein
VGLELGPLSLVSTTEELLGGKSTGSGLENREPRILPKGYVVLTMQHPLSAKVRTNLADMQGCLVSIVCSQTQAMEFGFRM